MMNKQRKTSHILNVFQYDETTGAVTLPSTLVLTAPASDDNSTKVGTTAWVRTYVSGLSYLTGNQSITVSGDATGSGTTSIVLTLANTAVTPGTYGSTTLVPVVTVDSKGRITSVTTAAISGSLTFTGDVTGSGTTGTSTALTLAASGVTAGTYTKVTVDTKGRVTVGASATTTDIAEGTRLYYTDARVLSYLTTNSYATQSYVGTQIANLVASAPAALDTLNELAAALGNDASFSTTISTALGNRLRVDINTQGLSATLQGYGRTNLGLGTAATSNTGDFVAYRTFGTAANNNTGDFAAASHTHSIANVTGLQTALDSKIGLTSLSFVAGSGAYNNTTGVITIPTNNNQITNGAGYITSYTEVDTLATVTGRGASTSTQVTFSGAGDNSTTYSSVRFAGYNQGGGVGYHGVFEIQNTYGSVTNGKKFIRIDGSGSLQIINSAYTLNIFNLTDAGALTVGSIIKSGGTSSQILMADGSVVTAGTGITISGGTISASGSAGVSSFNTRTGVVTLTSGDVTNALTFTPYNATNPSGYITSSALSGYATQSWVSSQGYLTSVTAHNQAWSTITSTPTTLSGYGISDAVYSTTSSFTTAGTGWYRVATTAGDGRGYYYIEVYTTGGNHNPSYLRIEAMGDWGNDKLIAAYTDLGFPASAVRITRSATTTFIEVNFTTTILGATMRVVRLGFDSTVSVLSGALSAGGNTVQETLNVTSKINTASITAPTVYAANLYTTSGSYINMQNHVHMQYKSLDYVNQIYQETGGQGNYMYANSTGSYGTLRLTSTRNGWYGIYFDSGSTLMMNANESGHYMNGYGWKWRWYNGTMYVSTGSYGGGTEYTVLHSGNIGSYAVTSLTDTLASVTARGATTSTETTYYGGLRTRKSQTAGNYTTAALWTESYDNTATGIAFHISGVKGTFLEMRTNQILYWDGNTVYHSGNLTNLNQLSNGPGYITSSSLTSYVPYTGATANIDTGGYSITAGAVTLTSNLWLKNIGTYDFIMSNGTSLTTNTIRAYYNTSDELRFYAKSTAGAAVVPKIMVGDGTTFYTIYHGGNIPTWNQNTTGNAATATYATNSTRLYASDGVYVYGGAAPYYGYLTYDGTYWLFQVTPATPSGVRVARADTAGSATSAGSAGLLTHNASRTDGTRYNIGWFTGASSPAYSCDAVQIRSSDGNIFATSYRGSGNVGGTGEASNHPAGIYSQGTNWLYGTIYMNNNVINDAGNITMISNAGIQYSSTHWLRPRDSSGNMHLKADTGGIYLDAGIIHFRNAAGGADTTISSGRLNFGDSGATPYANPTGTSVGISFGGWESSSLRTYGIFTELENVGGNYSKLTFNYHTGIRFGASSSYGGTRFYNNYVGAGSETFSINNGDNHVRVAYNLYVGGTISGSNLSGTNTGDQTNISGNAATATSAGYLTGGDSAAYMILGNITSGDLNTYNTPGLYSSEYNGVTNRPIDSTGHWIQISDAGGTDVKTQWYYHSNGTGIYMRLMWGNGTWRAWRTLITDSNIGSQTVASAGNATTAGGLAVHSSTNNEANKIVRTDVNGYIQAGWINSISGNMGFENRIARITCSTDQYMRYQTLTEFKVSLGMSGKNDYSRRIDYTSDANYHVGSFGHGGTDIGNPDRIFHYGSGFFDVWSGAGTYAPGTSHIHGFNALHYTTGYGGNAYGWQMASQYNQTGLIYARWCSGGSFSAWQTIITSANIGSQSVSYASTAGSAPANGGNSTTVGGVGIGNIVRNDTTGQYLRAFYQYGSYLTSETPINLVDQGIQGGGLRVDFMHPSYTGSGNWNHVITWSGYNGYNMYQLGGNYDGGTGTDLWVRSEANHGRTSWTSWRRLLNTSSDSYAANMNQYVRTSDAPSFAGLTVNSTTTLNAQVYINRHIDANTTWGSCGCNTIFVGWSSGKVVLGNGNSGGHDYANGLGSNSVVSTNPFYCYQDITAYSDSRVKENVEVVDNAVEKIKAIRGVTFTRNDVEDKTKRHAGVIAQEVLAVLPEAVSEDLNGHYSVAYGNMAALFIEAIKEQQLQIEELKNKLDNVLSSR